ncbi:unnamed protein product [Ilex paraguariensis]|uniref:GRAM domain-containing protein n=1 Tax=Ilex paraguariensis TaxID=185542 RepID=A0ABC8TS74_9AQUA
MMEQPDGGGERKTEADQRSSGSSGQDPNPKPDPKVEVRGDGSNGEQLADIYSDEREESYKSPNRSKKSVRWSEELVMESPSQTPMPQDDRSNPYVAYAPAPSDSASSSFNFKNTMYSVRDVLGRWGTKVGEATKKAEDLAGNTWQHLKTGPSLADAALGRIAQGTKVLAEGGYEKIFRQTFETVPEEQLQNSYACYLSTSAGPVMGILYVSTAKLAFCSDNPLSYKTDNKTEWSYYKVCR